MHFIFSATRFGIALPKWIVERENSMWVSEIQEIDFGKVDLEVVEVRSHELVCLLSVIGVYGLGVTEVGT